MTSDSSPAAINHHSVLTHFEHVSYILKELMCSEVPERVGGVDGENDDHLGSLLPLQVDIILLL